MEKSFFHLKASTIPTVRKVMRAGLEVRKMVGEQKRSRGAQNASPDEMFWHFVCHTLPQCGLAYIDHDVLLRVLDEVIVEKKREAADRDAFEKIIESLLKMLAFQKNVSFDSSLELRDKALYLKHFRQETSKRVKLSPGRQN